MPRKSKAEPWEGDSSDDNNWEPEADLDAPDLLSTFEDSRQKKETETIQTKSDVVDESTASRKRGRRDKKKKIEEIEKPRGVDRGLRPEKILAAQLYNSSVFFLVKWQDCPDYDVVPGKDLNQHYPEFVIQYYESCVPFSVRHKEGKVPRMAPELELPPPPMPDIPMDVSENLQPPELPLPSDDIASSLQEQPEIPEEQPTLPDISLPLPDLSVPEETQPMEVPV